MKKAKSQCMRLVARRDLVGQRLGRDGRGLGVGHFEDAGDAAHDRGAAAGFEVFLVLGAGLAQMHLGVDDAGQDVKPGAIDDFGRLLSKRPSPTMRPPAPPYRGSAAPSWLTTVPPFRIRS